MGSYMEMDIYDEDIYHYVYGKSKIQGSALNELTLSGIRFLKNIHEIGIIHRDLKPQNIMMKEVNQKTEYILIDFGISYSLKSEKR